MGSTAASYVLKPGYACLTGGNDTVTRSVKLAAKVGIRATELAAICFATFENVRGTVITYQYPPNYVSPNEFKEISNAVIPRAELAFRLITVEAFQHYVIGCPQRIEGVQYQRNTLQFNIFLVIKPKPCSTLDDVTHWQYWYDQAAGGLRLPIQVAYEALVLKINRYFYALEEDCAYLSRLIETGTAETGDVKMECLESLFKQLRETGTCVLALENCGSLYLRFSPQQLQQNGSLNNRLILDPDELVSYPEIESKQPGTFDDETDLVRTLQSRSIPSTLTTVAQPDWEITDESVFVLLAPLLVSTSSNCPTDNFCSPVNRKDNWTAVDCIARRLLPHIDGRHRLLDLAHLAKVDINVTRICLVHLIRCGIVRALPAPDFFRSSEQRENIADSIATAGWLGLPRLMTLLSDVTLNSACIESVIDNNALDKPDVGVSKKSLIVDIFRVYAMLCASPNLSIPHLLSANPQLRFVDVPTNGHRILDDFSSEINQRSLCQRTKISLLHLVQFGEINGLIHRLQCYPICVNHNTDNPGHPARLSEGGTSELIDPSASRLEPTTIVPCSFTIGTGTRATVKQQSTHTTTLSPVQSGPFRTCSVSCSRSLEGDEPLSEVSLSLMDGLHTVDTIACMLAMQYLDSECDNCDPLQLVSQVTDNLYRHIYLSQTNSIPCSQDSAATRPRNVAARSLGHIKGHSTSVYPYTAEQLGGAEQGDQNEQFTRRRFSPQNRVGAVDRTRGLDRKSNGSATTGMIQRKSHVTTQTEQLSDGELRPEIYLLWR